MIIIAVDPGKMTGVAVCEDTTKPNEWTFHSEEYAIEAFYDFIGDTVHAMVLKHGAENVRLVVESFIITANTAKNTQAPWSLELIGVCKFLAYRYRLHSIKLQQPSVAKTFATDQKLKTVEWHAAKTRGHANDAARHLMTYVASNGLVFDTDTLKKLALA